MSFSTDYDFFYNIKEDVFSRHLYQGSETFQYMDDLPLRKFYSVLVFYWFMNCLTEILKIIATLLRNSPQCSESMEVRRAFLSDMIKLFNNSRENRR